MLMGKGTMMSGPHGPALPGEALQGLGLMKNLDVIILQICVVCMLVLCYGFETPTC